MEKFLWSRTWSLKSLPKVSILNIPVDGRKYQAKVRLYLPPDLSEGKCYPLVINVYSGLNYQQVNNRFKQLGRGAATFIYQVD